jgi:hypothetical protein
VVATNGFLQEMVECIFKQLHSSDQKQTLLSVCSLSPVPFRKLAAGFPFPEAHQFNFISIFYLADWASDENRISLSLSSTTLISIFQVLHSHLCPL